MNLYDKNGKPKYAGMRYFNFNWSPNGSEDTYTNLIISKDAQSATDVFIRQFGNLKRNNINFIQEVSIDMENIGEPIIPEPPEDTMGTINNTLKSLMGFRSKKTTGKIRKKGVVK